MNTPFLQRFLLSSLFVMAIQGCDGEKKAAFFSKSSKLTSAATFVERDENAVAVTPTPTPAEAPTPKPDFTYIEDPTPTPSSLERSFTSTKPLDVSLSGGAAWAVTDTKAFRIELDAARNYPVQSWNIGHNQGNRTYVSEIGLLIGRTKRGNEREGIFVVGPNIQGGFQPIFKKSDHSPWMHNNSRMCVASFVVNGQSYVGGAFVDSNKKRQFVRIPIDKTKPNGVNISQKVVWDLGSAPTSDTTWWGYSCFMDQQRGIFWSDMGTQGAAPRYGVNVATGAAVAASTAPNAGVTFNNGVVSLSPQLRASYSMAGDANGNILSFPGAYTATHDRTHDLVYITQGGSIHVAKSECFATNTTCTAENGKFFSFSNNGIKPISALNDGRIIGVTRNNNSEVFLIQPTNPAQLNLGLTATKIAQLDGDAYMYTDFTGATLYAGHVEKTISLAEDPNYIAGTAVSGAKFLWKAKSGLAENWEGLTLQYRCFDNTSATRPAFASFTPANAGTEKDLPCSGKFNTVELKISSNGSSSFSRTQELTIRGTQRQE
jgi:hypothetical protein